MNVNKSQKILGVACFVIILVSIIILLINMNSNPGKDAEAEKKYNNKPLQKRKESHSCFQSRGKSPNNFPIPCPTTPGSYETSKICQINRTPSNCEINNCPIYLGGYNTDILGNEVVSLTNLNAPSRSKCDIGKCICKPGFCIHPKFDLCVSSDRLKKVNYGVAKGLIEWTCPYELCNYFDENTNEWKTISNSDFSKLCLPELYVNFESIPNDVDEETQIEILDSFIQFEYSK